MSRLHSGTVTRPRWESKPYRPCPARREHIFGKVQPANDNRNLSAWFWIQFAIYAACTAYAAMLWIVK